MDAIKSYQAWIEQEIKKQKFGKQPATLYEPIRYLMGLGGKRLRPLLTLLAYSLFKNDPKEIVSYAAAIEAFHNFTLMHDDIMDKAPLRRGHQTVHKKWDINTAIISGDVMLVKVYEMFTRLEAGKFKTVIQAFNQCAAEVCEGQQWDMEFERKDHVSEAQYLNMIRQKTAVLLGFSLELGAILADASDENRKALREAGTNMGIGFQLKDDLLDAYGDPEKFGKQVGGDIISNKKTYLLIKALEKSKGKSKTELTHWLEAKKFEKRKKVEAIKNVFDSLNIQSLTEKKVNHYFTRSFSDLEKVKGDIQAKDLLNQFAKNLIERQS
jgi:geranylgeranyl diphosphate synthase type II